jgi:hypothetical protein
MMARGGCSPWKEGDEARAATCCSLIRDRELSNSVVALPTVAAATMLIHPTTAFGRLRGFGGFRLTASPSRSFSTDAVRASRPNASALLSAAFCARDNPSRGDT